MAASAGHDTIQWQPIPSTHEIDRERRPFSLGPLCRRRPHKPGRDLRLDPGTRGRPAGRSALVFRAVRRPSDVSRRGRPTTISFTPWPSAPTAHCWRPVDIASSSCGGTRTTSANGPRRCPEKPTALAVNRAGSLIAVATADQDDSAVSRRERSRTSAQLTGPAGSDHVARSSRQTARLSTPARSISRGGPGRSPTAPERQLVPTPAGINAIALNKDGNAALHGRCGRRDSPVVARRRPNRPQGHPASRIQRTHESRHVAGDRAFRPERSSFPAARTAAFACGISPAAKQLARLDHGGPVTASPCGRMGRLIASAGANKLARLWQLKGGQTASPK